MLDVYKGLGKAMELLSVINARAVWIVNTQDLNPHGININMHLIEWLRNKYSFLKCPSSIYDVREDKALFFGNGSFQNRNGLHISVDLSIYNDGLIAEGRSSTRDSEAFIEDVLHSAVVDFGLTYKSDIIRKKYYLSELSLRSNNSLNNINPKMQTFIRKLTSMIGDYDPQSLELTGVGVSWDPALPNQQYPLSPFLFERTINIPFSEQRYYSRAPLHTDDHLAILNEFEELLVSKRVR